MFRLLRLLIAALVLTTHASAGTNPAPETHKAGGWRLETEASPYLRMHADNPVQWYPWGEEAFAKAKSENKPLFISIGYFTCHWCHVMERESFRNPEIAKLLNDGFVSIKVDREQRPDVDAAYMQFVQVTTGHGGWPMSVWATPDGDPFLGGTYFPPESISGRIGLKDLLPRIRERWEGSQKDLIAVSKRAVEQLRSMESGNRTLAKFTKEFPAEAQRQFKENYDRINGGFGSAPKFPQPGDLLFLLNDGNSDGQRMALHTLDKMAAGGVFDQLGGGFHRYSTDGKWHVPHFEKMLYDQALIARPYLVAYEQTNNPFYAHVAQDILNFVLQQLSHPGGGFYSALGADSPLAAGPTEETGEGAYYAWNWKQWKTALKDQSLRAWGAARFGVSSKGNVVSGELAGSNVLYLAKTVPELAKQFDISMAVAQQRESDVRANLLKARETRPAVPVDDKIVTVWNGFMITTLAEAGRVLQDSHYTQAAQSAADFVLRELYDPKRRVLRRDWSNGKRGVAGFAEDYAAMAEGLLALYDSITDKRWLRSARELTDIQIERFWDEKNGGFFGTTSDTRLWVRNKKAADGVTPSPNSIAVVNLLRLGQLLNNPEYIQYATRTAAWSGGLLRDVPHAMPYTLIEWPALMAAAKQSALRAGKK